MKIKGLVILAVTAAVITTSCNTRSGITSTKIQSAEDSVAYCYGVASYFMWMSDSLSLNPVLFAKGMIDAENKKNTLDEQAAQGYVMSFMQNRQAEKMKKQYGKNIDEGEKFLADNKKREGVKETASGLQYEVITMGTGAKPGPEETVKVHYTGTLMDGTKFDSSVDRNEPAVFGVNQVIKGWQEGIQLMPVGSKFKFYVPYELAYGENGTGPIPPYSTLIFDVELLDIVKK
jgi:FKBP-type peptidyl-prolyl cis-trans isomerase FklB